MPTFAIALFRRQHGVAAVRQLVELPTVTRGMVDGWIRRGLVTSPTRGVVVVRGAPLTPEAEAMLAVLRAGRGARLVGPRHQALLGIRGWRRTDAFGVLIPAERALPSKVDFPVFRDPRPDDGTAQVDGIPAPFPARGAIELARFLEGRPLLTAIDAARWERRPTLPGLLESLDALPSRYGPAARVRRWVRSGELAMESEKERELVRVVGDQFGPVEVQVQVTARRRVDALLRRFGIVLEYQGRDHRTAGGRDADLVRDEELEAVGLVTVPVFAEDLREPEALRRRIRRIIARLKIEDSPRIETRPRRRGIL